ncbi:MAG: hypothetical protein ABIP55_17360, partial [Tepidisphaeraceae bacterium]
GRVVVLGKTGRNFAAGMSGGIAYVYDDDGQFAKKCNMEMVELEKADTPEDHETLKRLLTNHAQFTGSPLARAVLDDFEKEVRWFVKVMPTDYRRVLSHMAEIDERARQLGARQSAAV